MAAPGANDAPQVPQPCRQQGYARSSGSPGGFVRKRCRRPPHRLPPRHQDRHPRPSLEHEGRALGTGKETRLPWIVPHLCGALELRGFYVRTGRTEENFNVRQIPQMRDRTRVLQDSTTVRTSQGRWRTFFHVGWYEGPAQAETPGIYVGMLVLPARCAAATPLGRRKKEMSPAVGGRRGSLNRDAVVAMGFTAPGTRRIFAADG